MGVNLDVRGFVFNIQSYCIHDGPGIRSTVFMQGCPLSCLWCQNPESQQRMPQLMFYKEKCRACGACSAACLSHAIGWRQGNKPATDRAKCTACGLCTEVCTAGAREISGREVSVREVLQEVLRDRMFFDRSSGGMTISGGEPLMQPDFTEALLTGAQDVGIHTAVESCVYGSKAVVDRVYRHVDLALCDIKCMDSSLHMKLTGVRNERILKNIAYIRNELKKDMEIRVPVVPGYNGGHENILAIAEFIAKKLDGSVPLRLLPYHRLGESKAQNLERMQWRLEGAELPDDIYMTERKMLAERYGLNVYVGG